MPLARPRNHRNLETANHFCPFLTRVSTPTGFFYRHTTEEGHVDIRDTKIIPSH